MNVPSSEAILVDLSDFVGEQLAVIKLLKKVSRLSVIGKPLPLDQRENDMLRESVPRRPEHILLIEQTDAPKPGK